MEDTIKTLEGIFETVYNEYKEYKDFLNSQTKDIEKGRNSFAKFAIDNKDNMDLITDKLFEVNEKPALQKNDFVKLQNKISNIYDVLKDVIDIPKEVREEINSIPKQRLSYKIEDGKAVEINVDMNNEIRKYAKEDINTKNFIKSILSQKVK